MENICRFKKRTVYPEMLRLDKIVRKSRPEVATNSWCEEPLESNGNSVTKDTDAPKMQENHVNSISENRQFIHDRIRHLVEAFNHRAQAARQRIELPATPSSSHETLDKAPITTTFKGLKTAEALQNTPVLATKGRSAVSNHSVYSYMFDKYQRNVIDPQGKIYVTWMCTAAIAVVFNAWFIPLRSTFPYQNANNRAAWMFFDYMADCVYFVDVLLVQPRIMFLSEGFWRKDIEITRQNYIRKRNFKLDILSLLPLDLLYIVFGPEKVILRFPRLLKLHTFWNFFDLVDKLIASPHIIRITRILLYMMYLIHLNACAYYAFSSWEGIGSNSFVYNGEGSAYITCFYFATKTATSIGKNPKPSKEIEYMFMTISWLMGVFVFAILIGQIRDIIATATRPQTECRKLVDETLEYMRSLNLPQDMQKRVQLWFIYTWETQHTLDENTIMDCLPNKMKTDIAINVHINTLSKVKLFADCDEALLRELVLQLRSVIYLPGDIICKKGDVGKEMYIIQSGRVQVTGRNRTEVLATLSESSVFGEISLLGIPGMNRRTADVRSEGYSNLFVLSKADLNAALSHYPEAQVLLSQKATQLMKKNADLEQQHKAVIVIKNPSSPPPQAKLIDTVLQVMPIDSKTNRLLRFGSKGWPKKNSANERFKSRNSLPCVIDLAQAARDQEGTFEANVTVHRSMS